MVNGLKEKLRDLYLNGHIQIGVTFHEIFILFTCPNLSFYKAKQGT